MAEKDWEDSTDVYRVVFIFTRVDDPDYIHTRILGPYGKIGQARSRRTSISNNYKKYQINSKHESYVQLLDDGSWVTITDKK